MWSASASVSTIRQSKSWLSRRELPDEFAFVAKATAADVDAVVGIRVL
ncbi:hypothetical protein ABZ863_06990 [Saccharomonospora sp. NPDC046836]